MAKLSSYFSAFILLEPCENIAALRCDLCSMYFVTPAEWVRHVQNTHTETELALSNNSTPPKRNYQPQRPLEGQVLEKSCSICKKTFPSYASMVIHKRTHTGLTAYLGNTIPDAIGSLLVGCVLAAVSTLIIHTSVPALVGRSIELDQLDKINAELENDSIIKSIHDVKGIDMGSNMIRYKAEIDINGRELSRLYINTKDMNILMEEVQKFTSKDELQEFILYHGENIVDMMGDEIDRLEKKLSSKFPKVRHIDLALE